MQFVSSLVLCALLLGVVSAFSGTALDDYVNTPDDVYGYNVTKTERGTNYTVYTLRMTSQRWQTAAYSDHSIWVHDMWICIPDQLVYTTHGYLHISSGSDAGYRFSPASAGTMFLRFCSVNQAVSTLLFQIPNQPITFSEGVPLVEDGIIARTFRSFLNESGANPSQILQFAMAKAAVRALDTVQDLVSSVTPHNLQTFCVSGGSKRGWATWLHSAVDERVTVIVPVVIPLLSMEKNIMNEWTSLGEWGWALDDYTNFRIFDFVGTPQFDLLMSHVDPLSYNDRYGRLKKLIIDGTLDQFFLLDGPKYFWDQLAEPKWLALVPNADHSFTSLPAVTDLLMETTISFFVLTATGASLPSITWNLQYSNDTETTPYVEVTTSHRSQIVQARQYSITTTRPGFRDFRLNQCATPNPATGQCFQYLLHGNAFAPAPLSPISVQGDIARYEANITNLVIAPTMSQQRWTGFFAQIRYSIPVPTGGNAFLTLTSEANIFPDFYPFAPYVPNYPAIGFCNLTVEFTQTLADSWTNANGESFSRWDVTLRNSYALYNAQVRVAGNIENLWGLTQVSGNVYKVPSYQYQNGVLPADSSYVTFGYIIKSSGSASIVLDNNSACFPSASSSCSVVATPTVISQWSDESGAAYQSVALSVTNTGSDLAANTRVSFNFVSGASLTQSWGLTQVSPSAYTCNLYNLQPSQTSSACGYTIASPSGALPAATVTTGQTICV